MLFMRCILLPRQPYEDICISVMSRHTLNDGFTPDARVNLDLIDGWWPVLAPSDELVGAWYRRKISWSKFEGRYRRYIYTNHQKDIEALIELSHGQSVAILCVELDPRQCHRRLLAQICQELAPGLKVIIE